MTYAAAIAEGRGLAFTLQALERHGSARIRDEMGPRYGIVTADQAFGVAMADLKRMAAEIGRDHVLAETLWDSGWYEARLLAAMIDDPARVSVGQMDRWRAAFDNWGVCDTVCFHLFDRTPHAYGRVEAWASLNDEFGRRAAFALLACLALHGGDEVEPDLLRGLKLVEAGAEDDRNFVWKGVSWALRAIGRRPALSAAATEVAERLAAAPRRTPRRIGKEALRAFARASSEISA